MKFEQPFCIGQCQVQPLEYSIQIAEEDKKSLQPKFVEVLCYLAQQYPRIIPRDELIEEIWAGNTYVGEKALTNAIWHLRQSLKGSNPEGDVIETIRKVGYRLLIEPIWLDKIVQKSHGQAMVNTQPLTKSLQYFSFKYFSFKYIAYILVLFISIFSFYYQQTNNDNNYSVPKITQITKSPGSELFPSPSPDGRYLVYSWSKNNTSPNLYMRDTHQPELPEKQLTFDTNKEGLSVWGKEGKYLYFARKGRDICNIIKMNVTTQQESVLATCSKRGGYYYLDVSPDNKTLAFHGFDEPADDAGIYFIDLEDPDAKAFRFSCANNCNYADRDMAFSPDGKTMAVSRRKHRFSENIFLVNIETKEAKQLTKDEEDIVGLTWHPNGKQLVYGAQRADVRDGYILNVASQHVHKMGFEGFSYPAFAKESGQLYYQHRKEKYYIASLTLNTEMTTSPFPVIQSDYNHHSPDYSAVTKQLVYVSNESGYYELWQADIDGSKRIQLTQLKQNIRYPKWSHDGKKVAFLAPTELDDGDRIFIYDLTTKTLKEVPSAFKKHNRPTWNFDDSSIISAIYTQEFTDLFTLNIDSGKAKRLTFDGGRYGIMLNETTLLYTNLKNGLWQKKLDTLPSNKPLNKISGKFFDARYTWNYFDNRVYFHKKELTHHQVAYYDFSQKKLIPLVRLPLKTFDNYGALTFIAEDNKLLFTSALYPQSDIKRLSHPLLQPN
jgi:Tol biopolymer transport system component